MTAKHGTFVWTDLSTYDMQSARQDYAALFGWSFSGSQSYDLAKAEGADAAAVFPMPDFLAKIDMPSFWMSYIAVDDVAATVAKARNHEGAIIEVEPQPFAAGGKIALIRDPSGAGFTVYEGPQIETAQGLHGAVTGRTHHSADVSNVMPFYTDLFGWRFEEEAGHPWRTFAFIGSTGRELATFEEVPSDIRGKYSYWMPCFSVFSAREVETRLAERGGQLFTTFPDGRQMMADQQGAHFLIQEDAAIARPNATSDQRRTPWRALLGIGCIWIAVVFNIQSFWGFLFLIWTWPAIRSGQTHFVEPISRSKTPLTYWGLVLTWIVLSPWLIAYDLQWILDNAAQSF